MTPWACIICLKTKTNLLMGLGEYLTQACELKLFLFSLLVCVVVKHKSCFVLKSSTTTPSKLLWLVLGLYILIK